MLIELPIIQQTTRLIDKIAGEGMAETVWRRAIEGTRLRPAHLSAQREVRTCRALFSRSVRLVEVETHSYCNRTCWFCPNSQIDRRSTTHYLSEPAYLQLLRDLATIKYRKALSFSRYNEPFADPILETRLQQARSTLPHARLIAYSNGDYLNAGRLTELSELGLDELHVGIYLADAVPWCPSTANLHLERALRRFGLKASKRREIPGKRIAYHYQKQSMRIRVFCPNYSSLGTDRGGTIDGVTIPGSRRSSPCLYPLTEVYIDYNGSIMPCCHLRSDVSTHGDCIIGTLDARPGAIFRCYGGPAAARWRRSMCNFDIKTGPCQHCTARPWTDNSLGRILWRCITGLPPQGASGKA